MNKSIKKGLGILITATGIMAGAMTYSPNKNESTKNQPHIEQYSLEKIDKVYRDYLDKFNATKNWIGSDVEIEEIQPLYVFLKEHLTHMPNAKSDEEAKKLIENINKENRKTYDQKATKKQKLNEIADSLDEKVLIHFPGLEEKDYSIKYNAERLLKQEDNKTLKELLNETNKTFNQEEKKDLSRLINKEQYTVQDLLSFHLILKKKRLLYALAFEWESYKLKEIPFVNLKHHYQTFDAFLKDVEDWKKTGGSNFKYISPGFIGFIEGDSHMRTPSRPKNNLDKKIEEIFGKETDEIREDIPINSHFPLWLGLIFSFGGAVAVKNLIKAYTGNKWKEDDTGETMALTIASMFDFCHPLVFPIRVFGVPLATEFIRKFISEEKNE